MSSIMATHYDYFFEIILFWAVVAASVRWMVLKSREPGAFDRDDGWGED